jgi:hypothetical protein
MNDAAHDAMNTSPWSYSGATAIRLTRSQSLEMKNQLAPRASDPAVFVRESFKILTGHTIGFRWRTLIHSTGSEIISSEDPPSNPPRRTLFDVTKKENLQRRNATFCSVLSGAQMPWRNIFSYRLFPALLLLLWHYAGPRYVHTTSIFTVHQIKPQARNNAMHVARQDLRLWRLRVKIVVTQRR